MKTLFNTVAISVCVFLLIGGCQKSAAKDKESIKTKDEVKSPLKAAPAQAQVAAPVAQAETQPAAVAPVPTPAPAPAVVKPSGPAPQIKFANTVYDCNEMKPNSKNIATYTFTNVGKGKLKILDIQKTCGCTVPELVKREYEPGESGTIKVEYESTKVAGPVLKHLFVMSDDPNSPRVEITLKGVIVLKVEYEPKTLQFLYDMPEANMPSVVIYSKDNKAFAVKGMESTDNTVTAQFDPNEQATKFVFKLKVNMDKLKIHANGYVKFNITHPDIDTLTLSYSTTPEFDVQPPSLIVRSAIAKKPEQRELWIKSNYSRPFEIQSVSSKNSFIKVLKQEKMDNMYKLTIEITPPELQKIMFFSDTLTINVKDKSPIEVMCRGFYTRAK
jgi:hypothetical protein